MVCCLWVKGNAVILVCAVGSCRRKCCVDSWIVLVEMLCWRESGCNCCVISHSGELEDANAVMDLIGQC